ncbi:MAG TPA: molybdopterin cofactor-binding domain-containing protein [Vicinamibacterales bacterium]|jgi:CO/xanthine dehydrogenase Mo-binding subunit|nr:molybdopterin cofactor-binding domain-containing protein [Vicinamibacterales bacterium]
MTGLPRRDFLKAGGALFVGFSLRDAVSAQTRAAVAGPPDPKLIDTWLAVHSDNTATVYLGFAELGQGNSTSLLQIAAEELDLGIDQVETARLDTDVSPNQGGTYSSASIARGGPQIRTAAAEARLALLKMAAGRLNAPLDSLTVSRGVVTAAPGSMQVTYGQLVGDRRFDLPITGTAVPKKPDEYKVVGAPIPRRDIENKIDGTYVFMQHVRIPEVLHGRVVRPRGQRAYGAGAKVLGVEEDSIRQIPGARVVRKGDFLGVVAQDEWDAVRAAAELKVTWDTAPSLPGDAKLFERMRLAATSEQIVVERGDVAATLKTAPHVVSRICHAPYQAHAPFGPNCAVADVKSDSALVICSTQDVYATRRTIAGLLALPIEKVRVQYYEGSGTYGHSCYDDAAQAAALLSQAVARPVRVQFMRWDEHGWDNYGPAHVGEVRAAADGVGKLVAYEYHGWQHNWSATETSAQLTGVPAAEWGPGGGTAQGVQGVNRLTCGGMYQIPNLRLVNHKLPVVEYFRAGWLRSPLDLAFAFASEQAIDQLALLLNIDPYEFRRRNIADERWLGVLDAVANAARWSPRQPAAQRSEGRVLTGRGIGLGTHLQSWGAAVADIEVDRETGKVVAKHMYGAIDAGLAVNPAIVESQICGQLVQTCSRMFYEEVAFDTTSVTSLDWSTYRVLRFEECPEVTPIVVQRLNERSSGAGEEVMAAAAGAIANAFFDATRVRMDQFPLTPPRVLAALERGSR